MGALETETRTRDIGQSPESFKQNYAEIVRIAVGLAPEYNVAEEEVRHELARHLKKKRSPFPLPTNPSSDSHLPSVNAGAETTTRRLAGSSQRPALGAPTVSPLSIGLLSAGLIGRNTMFQVL